MRYINGTRLDDRIVRTDWDAGFAEGRQYGRGKTGGQVCLYELQVCMICYAAAQHCVLSVYVPISLSVLACNCRLECVRKFKFDA